MRLRVGRLEDALDTLLSAHRKAHLGTTYCGGGDVIRYGHSVMVRWEFLQEILGKDAVLDPGSNVVPCLTYSHYAATAAQASPTTGSRDRALSDAIYYWVAFEGWLREKTRRESALCTRLTVRTND